jgi:hypothetical protein
MIGVWHCCLDSTGSVAVAVLKASKGPEALVAVTVRGPAQVADTENTAPVAAAAAEEEAAAAAAAAVSTAG